MTDRRSRPHPHVPEPVPLEWYWIKPGPWENPTPEMEKVMNEEGAERRKPFMSGMSTAAATPEVATRADESTHTSTPWRMMRRRMRMRMGMR
eukprot:4647706-Pyramimonas_sp.AAC.1